jgi:hypothetical protein
MNIRSLSLLAAFTSLVCGAFPLAPPTLDIAIANAHPMSPRQVRRLDKKNKSKRR